MKNFLFYFSYLLLYLFSFECANCQWQECNQGMNGGIVNCITTTDNGMYAGLTSGVYFSSDNGKKWVSKNKGLDKPTVNGIIARGESLYAATGSGIVKSTNGGDEWFASGNGMNKLEALSLNQKDSLIFAGTKYGLYVSSDEGASWNILADTTINYNVCLVYVKDNYIFVGSNSSVFLSTDNGAAWKRIYSSGMVNAYSFVMVDSMLYLGINGYVLGKSVKDSTWSDLNNGMIGGTVYSLLEKNGVLYAGFHTTGGGFFRSTNAGQKWTNCSKGLTGGDYNGVYCLAAKDSLIFAGTSGGGIYVSSDGGDSWAETSDGIGSCQVTGVIKKDNNLFASCYGKGVFKSTDDGASWNFINIFNGIRNADCIAASGSNIIFFSGNMYVSGNAGQDWDKIDNGTLMYMSNCFKKVPDGLLAAGWRGVIKSTDDGRSWKELNNGQIQSVYFWSIDVCDSVYITGGSWGGYGIYRSTNKGELWVIDTLHFIKTQVSKIFSRNGLFYAASDSGLFMSTDMGKDWIDISGNLPSKRVINVFEYDGFLLAATNYDGLFVSFDGGVNWKEANNGLPHKNVRVPEFSLIDGYLYAGTTTNGLYRMKLSDIAALGVDEAAPEPLLTFFPNPASGNLYIYTQDRLPVEYLTVFNPSGERFRLPVKAEGGAGVLSLDISSLPAGIYFLRVGDRTGKFIKE